MNDTMRLSISIVTPPVVSAFWLLSPILTCEAVQVNKKFAVCGHLSARERALHEGENARAGRLELFKQPKILRKE